MRYLFIDTSTHYLTIAISSIDEIISETTSRNTKEHSKYALVELENVFAKVGLKPNDIDKIMVINGPGSFTGVRIGVTIAKTYAWALKKDIIPISSLHAFALSCSGYDYYISVLDARRNYVYAAIYNEFYESVLEEQYISIDKLNDIIENLTGNIVVIGDINVKEYKSSPIKIDVLKIVQYYKDIKPITPHLLNPHYLKRVEAEEKLMGVSE